MDYMQFLDILNEGVQYKFYADKLPEDEFNHIFSIVGNKEYGRWVVEKYIAAKKFLNKEKLEKLLTKLPSALNVYNSEKKTLDKPKQDIFYFKSFDAFFDFIYDLMYTTRKNMAPVKKAGMEDMITKVYEDGEWLLVAPLTKEASCKYGANTKWCTAAKNNNMFNDYNIIIFINKTTGKKFQFGAEVDNHHNYKDFSTSRIDAIFYNDQDDPLTPKDMKIVSTLPWEKLNKIFVQNILAAIYDGGNNDEMSSFIKYFCKWPIDWEKIDLFAVDILTVLKFIDFIPKSACKDGFDISGTDFINNIDKLIAHKDKINIDFSDLDFDLNLNYNFSPIEYKFIRAMAKYDAKAMLKYLGKEDPTDPYFINVEVLKKIEQMLFTLYFNHQCNLSWDEIVGLPYFDGWIVKISNTVLKMAKQNNIEIFKNNNVDGVESAVTWKNYKRLTHKNNLEESLKVFFNCLKN